jgi:amino-acid N-acetyltransferase
MEQGNAVITKAVRADLADLLALLTEVNLPHEGVSEHLHNFFVARDEAYQLVGCAGLERYGSLGLLRSVAVSPGHQHTGLGSKLTAALLDHAAQHGIAEVVLLTATARDFFANRFGFEQVNRQDFDDRLAESREWKLPRCSSAVCMSCEIQPNQ